MRAKAVHLFICYYSVQTHCTHVLVGMMVWFDTSLHSLTFTIFMLLKKKKKNQNTFFMSHSLTKQAVFVKMVRPVYGSFYFAAVFIH